ncbi:30S ribosomal protein S6 [[Mycoplasma] testudinis]|uniref:30S ribosomal protein S6 n=1 Tax=[Mycoplasma] testudinis TaxID=33924 RepID=UPI000698739B|nr:30S ribosomal protein S6 [[Mycoplasma] testudinis]
MAKYEVMLLVSGKISPEEASNVTEQMKQNIVSDNIETKYLGIKGLSYDIKKESTAHYFQLNFDGGPKSTFDFNRLALINKSILRHLIINLEKDYGWRAINNEKKVKLAKHRLSKFDEIMANPDAPRPLPRKARYEKSKRREEWELVRRVGSNGPEDTKRVAKSTSKKDGEVKKIEVKKPVVMEIQGQE